MRLESQRLHFEYISSMQQPKKFDRLDSAALVIKLGILIFLIKLLIKLS